MKNATTLLSTLALALLAGACTPDFDKISIVKDLRILGMRADPPEIIMDKSPDVWPPVKVDALVVDPTLKAGETVEWEIWACASGGKTSVDDQVGTGGANYACCPFPQQECTEDLKNGPFKLASGDTAPDKIGTTVVLTKDLYKAALIADSQKGLGGVPIKVELRVRRKGELWQRGLKRLVYGVYDQLDLTCLPPINPDSLDKCIQQQRCEEFLFVCLRDGVCSICNGIPKEDQGTKQPKVANSNPAVTYVKVSEAKRKVEGDEESEVVPSTWSSYADQAGKAKPAVWNVTAGKEQWVLPKPDPVLGGHREWYVVGSRVPTYDEANQTFQYTQILEEHLTYHFFATDGQWTHETTGGKPTRFFVNKKIKEITSRWLPPRLDQEGDPDSKDVTLWVVVRDDRGGTDWMTFNAKVTREKK